MQVICLLTVKMSNSAIRPIDMIQSGSTTPGQSERRSNGNEEVLHIPQISDARALPSDRIVSEVQSVYFKVPADWANFFEQQNIYICFRVPVL